ncbi:hypothetical protein JTB14_006606 [Gonioctena quinquepunctata]|nr:hypothetical protein JTB14_006606 [Gonioctena quinquepunctata]
MLRFIKKCKRGLALTPVDIKYVQEENNSTNLGKMKDFKTLFSEIEELNAGEIIDAEKRLYKEIQGGTFPEEIETLKNNISPRKWSRLDIICSTMGTDRSLRL